jgi:hypothetical protein
VASAAYELSLKKFMDADIDLSAGTIKARLVRTSAYTFSQAHDFADDLPATIVADVTLGTKTTTAGVFDAADAVFTAVPAGAAINAVVIYEDTGGAASTDPLIVYLDGFSVVPNGGDITLQWAASSPNIWKIAP